MDTSHIVHFVTLSPWFVTLVKVHHAARDQASDKDKYCYQQGYQTQY